MSQSMECFEWEGETHVQYCGSHHQTFPHPTQPGEGVTEENQGI